MGKQPFKVDEFALGNNNDVISKEDEFDLGPVGGRVSRAVTETNTGFEGNSKYDTGLTPYSDQNIVRSRNQPWYDQLGNSIAKVVPGSALSLVENVGDVAELFDNDKDKAYTNVFTELALKGKQSLDEKFHTYQETDPNKFASIHDSGWWFNFGDGIAQSIAGFMAVGAGVGKVLGTSAKLINGALKSGETGIKIGQGLAQLGTATALSYTEGVQIGADVYQNIKQDVLQNGYDYGDGVKVPVDEVEARRIASVGSSEAVKLNTILGTGVNITGIAPLFKSYGKLSAPIRVQLARGVEESIPKWINRLTELEKTIPNQASPLKFLAQEALQESFEEGGINLYAESEGYRKSGIKSKMVRSNAEDAIDRFADILFSEEGAVNALGGAVGGIVQSGVLEHAPVHEYNGQRVSSRTKEHLENNDYKNELIHSLKGDINTIQENQKALNTAVVAGDQVEIESARNKLFNVAALKSFRNETVNELSHEISQIGIVDNTKIGIDGLTDAQRQGLADNIDDNNYKIVAAKKAADLHVLNKEYRNLSALFPNNHARDEAFRKRLDVYASQSTVDKFTQDATTKESQLLPLVSDPTIIPLVKQNAELQAHQHAITFLGAQRTEKNAIEIDKRIKTLNTERNIIEALYEDSKKLDKDFSSKIRANQGVVNPLVGDYTNLLIAKGNLNFHKLNYSSILSSPKNFSDEVKSEVVKGAKIKEDIEKSKLAQQETAESLNTQTQASDEKKQKQAEEIKTKPTTDQKVAVYGTLRNPETRKQVFGRDVPSISTNIHNVEVNQEENYKTPYPSEKQTTPGQLIELTPEEVAMGDRSEKNYNRTILNTDHGPAQVWTRKADIDSEGNKVIVPLASDQLDAINIPDNTYQGKTFKEAEVEQLALASTIETNTLNDTPTNGKQNKFAYLAQNYDKETGRTIDPRVINNSYKILHSSGFSVGANLTLRVTTDYIEFDEKGRRKEGKHGKLTRYSTTNIPIEILHNGEMIGYVPIFLEDDPQALYDLREFMIHKREQTTKVTAKDWGVINKIDKGKIPVSEAFPIQPKFVVGKNEKAYTNLETVYPNSIANAKQLNSGYLYGIVTTPNGKELALPLDINKISEEVSDSIVNALDLFIHSENLLPKQKQMVEDIFTNYNLDITTQKGFQEYVNKFTVTTDLSDSLKVTKINDNTSKDNFYVQVSNTGLVFLQSGRAVKDKNGNYTAREVGKHTPHPEEFYNELREFLIHTYARIDLSKLQENQEFKAPLIKEDNYTDLKYNTYSDYIASNSSTNIIAVKLNETEQTVFVQPTVYFDNSFLSTKPIEKTAILATSGNENKTETPVKKGFTLLTRNLTNTKLDPNQITQDQANEIKKSCE